MTMPRATSASVHDPSTGAVVRLVDTGGRDGPATPPESVGHLHAGTLVTWSIVAFALLVAWPIVAFALLVAVVRLERQPPARLPRPRRQGWRTHRAAST